MKLLEIADLVAGYGPLEVLHGVSLSVDAGEIVVLLGANGAGKTTLLRAISGLLPAQRGAIRLAGRPLAGLAPEAIARLGIAHVPEGRRIFPGLTVRENLLVGATARPGLGQKALAAEAERSFALFPELEDSADRLGWTLSGGQQQMLALARALIASPRLLLLDEPSLGLAPRIVARLAEILGAIAAAGVGILLAEQNVAVALTLARRGYLLDRGRLAGEGDAASLCKDARVTGAYLGVAKQPGDAAEPGNAV